MNKATWRGIGTLAFWSTLALMVTLSGGMPPFQLGAVTFLIGGAAILLIENARTGEFAAYFRLPVKIYAFGVLGLCAVLGAAVWAGYSTLAKTVKYPPGATGAFFLTGAALSFALHLAMEETIWPETTWQWLFVILLGLGRMSYTVWDDAMKHGDQLLLTSLSFFIPLASVGWLVLAGYAPADTMALLAGAAILIGCLVTNIDRIRDGLKRRRAQG